MDIFSYSLMGLAFILAAILAGLFAGLFGIGGGLVIVPVLYFLLQAFEVTAPSAMAIATATSLAIIIPTAVASARSHWRQQNIDVQILKWWGPFVLAASFFGGWLATKLSGNALTWGFALLALLTSLNLFFRASAKPWFAQLPNKMLQALMACVVGTVSVLVGIGGGTLTVPMLTACSVVTHKAVGTAAAFGVLVATPGALALILIGQTPADAPVGTWQLIHLPAFFCFIPLTTLFAPIGAKLANRLNPIQLKKAFALVLFLTGGRMLLQAML